VIFLKYLKFRWRLWLEFLYTQQTSARTNVGTFLCSSHLFITIKRFFELFVAMDRFAAAFFHMRYHVWSVKRRAYKLIVGCTFILGSLMSMLDAVDMLFVLFAKKCHERHSSTDWRSIHHDSWYSDSGTVHNHFGVLQSMCKSIDHFGVLQSICKSRYLD